MPAILRVGSGPVRPAVLSDPRSGEYDRWVQAIRADHVFDGESFVDGGATVLFEAGRIAGIEGRAVDLPQDCEVREHHGTLLPGLIDAHTHLVTDSGMNALDRVAGYSTEEIDEVITQALADHLAAGVTTVRDLGDRDFCVLRRRDRRRSRPPADRAHDLR